VTKYKELVKREKLFDFSHLFSRDGWEVFPAHAPAGGAAIGDEISLEQDLACQLQVLARQLQAAEHFKCLEFSSIFLVTLRLVVCLGNLDGWL
jgi:hypothetical protein